MRTRKKLFLSRGSNRLYPIINHKPHPCHFFSWKYLTFVAFVNNINNNDKFKRCPSCKLRATFSSQSIFCRYMAASYSRSLTFEQQLDSASTLIFINNIKQCKRIPMLRSFILCIMCIHLVDVCTMALQLREN